MPKRALVERRPWLVASVLLALVTTWLQSSRLADPYLMGLAAGPFVLLAIYAALRQRGRDTGLLAAMVGLEGLGWALATLSPDFAVMALWLAFLAGLSLFLQHRVTAPQVDRRIAAAALLLGTPVLCVAAGGMAMLVLGLALGAMAASAWISTFPRERVGAGGLLIVAGMLMAMIDTGGIEASGRWLALAAWPVAYLGNLVLATGVTGELRAREAFDEI